MATNSSDPVAIGSWEKMHFYNLGNLFCASKKSIPVKSTYINSSLYSFVNQMDKNGRWIILEYNDAILCE